MGGNVVKPFSGQRTVNAIVVTLFWSSRCAPRTHGYHLYLRTLFAISINRKIPNQLQSYASVLAKRTSLVNTMTPDQESSRAIVRGLMQQASPSV